MAHPSLEILGGARDLFLPALGSLTQPYNPFPIIGSNRHVETIFASFYRSTPEIRRRRECHRAADDGTVSLDWVSADDRLLAPSLPSSFSCLV